jgi:hypothetical protein
MKRKITTEQWWRERDAMILEAQTGPEEDGKTWRERQERWMDLHGFFGFKFGSDEVYVCFGNEE